MTWTDGFDLNRELIVQRMREVAVSLPRNEYPVIVYKAPEERKMRRSLCISADRAENNLHFLLHYFLIASWH